MIRDVQALPQVGLYPGHTRYHHGQQLNSDHLEQDLPGLRKVAQLSDG